MLLRILRNLFKDNKLLLLFMVMTSVLTAVIGCFIYGVYENYRNNLLIGESKTTTVKIEANEWSGWMTSRTDLLTFNTKEEELNDLFRYNNFSSITKGDISKVLKEIPESMYEEIEWIYCSGTFENDLFGLAPFDFIFKLTDKGIVNVMENPSEYDLTDEEYINGEKHIVVSDDFLNDTKTIFTGTLSYDSNEARTLTGIGDKVSICGTEYTVSNTIPSGVRSVFYSIPFTSLPDKTILNAVVSIQFIRPVTYNQFVTIDNIVNSTMADHGHVVDMDLSVITDFAYYRTIIFITAAVALLFAVNLAVLYKYIIECNKKRITVFRLCGSTRGRCIALFLGQAVTVISPGFILSLYAFHKLLYPKMVEIFPNSINCLNFNRYVCIFAGYIAVSAIVLFVMLIRNISRKLNFTEANI